jgi:hypothetical protein
MRLFLQLEVGRWEHLGYNRPFLNLASSLATDVIGADMDNESEAYISELVLKLLHEADSTMVLIRSHEPEAALGPILSVLNYLISQRDKVHQIILWGNHPLLVRMLKHLTPKFTQLATDDEIRISIARYAKSIDVQKD